MSRTSEKELLQHRDDMGGGEGFELEFVRSAGDGKTEQEYMVKQDRKVTSYELKKEGLGVSCLVKFLQTCIRLLPVSYLTEH